MSFPTNNKQKTPVVAPCQTMQGHTDRVKGVVHLPEGRRIITCSLDGSLRLWDLKLLDGSAQISEDWQGEEKKKAGVYKITLSPNGKTVVSGSEDGKVRLWDVETGKVITKWIGHTDGVVSVCWSVDGNRVLSGSQDRTARVWDVETGETILKIKTGHVFVWTVIYSPDNTKIATGGFNQTAAKIWDARTGKLLCTLKHDWTVWSLAWTSDGKKLISASYGPIRIFDTATWQEIAVLEGHTINLGRCHHLVSERPSLLATASDDKTARLWNLDTNLQIGPPLQHEDQVESAAFSTDGKVLVTGCDDKNAYTWDIHAILKRAGLEDLLPTGTNIKASQGEPGIEHTPRSSISDKSFLEADATRCHDECGGVDKLSPRFFDGMEADDDSSQTGGSHMHSSANALLARLASLLRRFRPNNVEATGLPQPPTPSVLHPRVLLSHLSSLFYRSRPQNDGANEPHEPSTHSGLDLHVLFARLSSLLSRSPLDERPESHPTTPLSSRPDALIDILSSLSRAQPRISDEIELPQRTMHPHVVEVPAMRDREVLFVAEPLPQKRLRTQPNGGTTPGGRPAYPLPVRMLAHLVLFLCCASPQHPDGNTHSTQQQQQGQPQGPVQVQTPSPQTQLATPLASTSAIPTAPDTRTTLTRTATA